ncbi:MAG: AAA family ATPase [Verrucomicrobia bacterium]|jgi:holliday junction DNA helicase RuvB|nr:AAA family ATPase [Verrucomicrobiota bacterium]
MGRPVLSWHKFVGQRDIVSSLQDHCRGALSKGEELPHTQLGGPSGSGKTMMARAVAAEMGTQCFEFYSSRQSRKWQLAELLQRVKKADLVFVDEIHALPVDSQELLFPAIDQHRVPKVDTEKRRVMENEWVDIAPFTLVVATDQPGTLRNALKQRIVLRYTLAGYTVPEMRQIVSNYSAELQILLKPQAQTRVAAAARGIPRRARHLLKSIHTVMLDLTIEVTKSMVTRHLASLGIDKDNLTGMDRRYLAVLCQRKGHVSLTNLAIQLGTDTAAVQRDIEGYLIQLGLIGIDARGRFLTPTGETFVRERGL